MPPRGRKRKHRERLRAWRRHCTCMRVQRRLRTEKSATQHEKFAWAQTLCSSAAARTPLPQKKPVQRDVFLKCEGDEEVRVGGGAILVTVDVLLENPQISGERALRAIPTDLLQTCRNPALLPLENRFRDACRPGGLLGRLSCCQFACSSSAAAAVNIGKTGGLVRPPRPRSDRNHSPTELRFSLLVGESGWHGERFTLFLVVQSAGNLIDVGVRIKT